MTMFNPDELKEAMARWEKIVELRNKIDEESKNDTINLANVMPPLLEAFVLLVDHLKPINPDQATLDAAMEGLEEDFAKLLKNIKR